MVSHLVLPEAAFMHKKNTQKLTKILSNLSTHNISLFWTQKSSSNREDKGIFEIAKNFAHLCSWMKIHGWVKKVYRVMIGIASLAYFPNEERQQLTQELNSSQKIFKVEFIFWETANWSLNIIREYNRFFLVLKKSRKVSKNRSTKFHPGKFKRYKILLNVLKGMFWKPWTLPNPKKCAFRCLSQRKTMILCICNAVYYLLFHLACMNWVSHEEPSTCVLNFCYYYEY